MKPIKLFIYITSTGKVPFKEWKKKLDKTTRSIIRVRLDRVQLGNLGDCKQLRGAKGIWELRIQYGPGYRVYFGKKGNTVVILLTAGDKKNQIKDIEKAKKFWLECKDISYE